MISSWFRGVSPKRVSKGLLKALVDGPLLDLAAQLSYFFLFSLFPLLLFVVALAPYLPLQGVVEDALQRLAAFMPGQAMEIVQVQLRDLTQNTRPRLLSLGLVLALWSASRGVNAMRIGLNMAYDVQESRPFLRVQVLSVIVTIVTAVLVLLCLGLMVLGGRAGTWLAAQVGLDQFFVTLWAILRWPLSVLIILAVIALNYYLLPDVKQRFIYLTPGSVLATVLWLASTWGFTQYAEQFGNYNATYGSIGGVVVLMTWLYLTGLIFLIGGKLNALIEHDAAQGKERGARADDEAPLPAAQRPSQGATPA